MTSHGSSIQICPLTSRLTRPTALSSFSASFAMFYGLSFASITAVLTHVFLYFCKRIAIQARRSLSEQPVIHARLMSVYNEVPDWWYLTIFCLCPKLYCKAGKGNNNIFSDHVRVWCRCHRGVEDAAPRMGFCACPPYLCVYLTWTRFFCDR